MRDLASEMGINGPSLYNAFGDKRALFASALERYAAGSMRERIRQLERLHPPAAAIQVFFRDLIALSLSDADRRGCFIVNSALEVAPHDAELRGVICGYLSEIENFFARCLEAAKAADSIPSSIEPRDTARMLLGVMLGLRVMARARPERTLLDDMVSPALAFLNQPNSHIAKGKT